MSTLSGNAPAPGDRRPASVAPLFVLIALILLGLIAVAAAFARM